MEESSNKMSRIKFLLATGGLAAMMAVSPSYAVVVDLTTAGACTPITLANIASCSINGAVYTQAFTQSTGTGVIDPFLREQATGVETGLNTDNGTPYDDKAG